MVRNRAMAKLKNKSGKQLEVADVLPGRAAIALCFTPRVQLAHDKDDGASRHTRASFTTGRSASRILTIGKAGGIVGALWPGRDCRVVGVQPQSIYVYFLGLVHRAQRGPGGSLVPMP